MSLALTQLAMYRYNFWSKALLHPTAPGMDNSTFVSNSMASPALMVLSSSSETHLGSRNPITCQSFTSEVMGKEIVQHLPPLCSAGFVLRPVQHFHAPLFSPISPFVGHNIEHGINILSGSSRSDGNFHHIGYPDGFQTYHSAFAPAKRANIDEVSCTSIYDKDREKSGFIQNDISRKCLSPPVNPERPSSISSTGCDTNSEVHSETGDLFDRGTPDLESRTIKRTRKRPVDGHFTCCPICGITLRPGEAELHLAVEVQKLEHICWAGAQSKDSVLSGKKSHTSPSSRKVKDSPGPETVSRARFESYTRIRCNRQNRLNARSRNKKRRGLDDPVCPICGERLTGMPEELNSHVDMCLRKQRENEDEESVDVDGSEEQYEEYTWAGVTRVRATTMLQGGFAASGFQTAGSSYKASEDEGDLNVDGDDTEQYGQPQFSEKDLVPLSDVSANEDGVLQSCFQHDEASEHGDKFLEAGSVPSHNVDSPLNLCRSASGSIGERTVVEALKAKLADLDESREMKQKCLICMNHYQEPTVSIQCWHVHCQRCWCQTLGAKKLCPQCNMITSPGDLRRIYL